MSSAPRRATSFGRRAADYERFRPGYPSEVVDLVVSRTATGVRTALEIGAGTGKATRVLDAAGMAVTALEPDPAMAAILREHVSERVRVVEQTFEDAGGAGTLTGTVDLVLAAASLHWTEPTRRWERITSVLAAGGVAAVLGGGVQVADDELRARVREAREPEVTRDDHPRPAVEDPSGLRWPAPEMLESGRFADVEQLVVPRRWTWAADDFVGYLSTLSLYLTLDASRSRDALRRVRAAIPDELEVRADLTLHIGSGHSADK